MVWSTYPLSHHQRTQVRAALWILSSQVTFSNSTRPHQRWGRSGRTEIHASTLYHKKCNDKCAHMHYWHKNTNPRVALSAWVEEYICAYVHKHKGYRPAWRKHKLCNSSSFVPSSTLKKLLSFHRSSCHTAIECCMSIIHCATTCIFNASLCRFVSMTDGVNTVHENCSLILLMELIPS